MSVETKAVAVLSISGQQRSWEIPLDATGLSIGRSSKCDLVLESEYVSKRHAMLFVDPFGRWIIEDLGSRNGVIVNGECVQAKAVQEGDTIVLGDYRLSLSPAEPIAEAPELTATGAETTTMVTPDAPGARVQQQTPPDGLLPAARLRELRELGDRLASRSRPAGVYAEACRALAAEEESVALVVRLPTDIGQLPEAPPALAVHRGGQSGAEAAARAVPLSRPVLEMAIAKGGIVSRSGMPGPTGARPQSVLCASLAERGEALDVLYAEVPQFDSTDDFPEFFQAVVQQVRFALRGLQLAEARAERRALDAHLALAREIQDGLIPRLPERLSGVDVAFSYQPALWVGGDYCDVWQRRDGKIVLTVGDVSGKGLPAAMIMANLHGLLRTTLAFLPKPAEALSHVNQRLLEQLPEGLFVTLWLGVYDPTTYRLEYVDAGHVPAVVSSADGQLTLLEKPKNSILGLLQEPYVSGACLLEPGCGVLALTDGITEATASDGRQFGIEGVQAVLKGKRMESAEAIVQHVIAAASALREDAPRQDDITALALLRR